MRIDSMLIAQSLKVFERDCDMAYGVKTRRNWRHEGTEMFTKEKRMEKMAGCIVCAKRKLEPKLRVSVTLATPCLNAAGILRMEIVM